MRTTWPVRSTILAPRRILPVLVALLALSTAGCYSTSTAYNGRFTFAYASGLDFQNFVKPIAPGAKLDVVVFANGTEEMLTVTKVVSSNAAVLNVVGTRDKTITVKAGSAGVAELEVTARDGNGKLLVDKMFFHVAVPVAHSLEHACTSGTSAIYVRGGDVDVFHHLATSDGRTVIGYDYAPVRVEPAGALELTAQPQTAAVYRYRTSGTIPSASLTSTVDGSQLSLRIVDQGELKDAALLGDDTGRMLVGDARYAVAQVSSGETPVCSQNALTKARSLTPDICSVSAKLDEGDKDENHEQLAVITALAFGTCKYEVTLPELDGGRGVTLTAQAAVGRVEFPDDRGDRRGHGRCGCHHHDHHHRRASWWFGTAALVGGALFVAPNLVVLAGLALARARRRREP